MTEQGAPRHALRNIEEIVRLEAERAAESRPFAKLADSVAGFAGSTAFVAGHGAVIAAYVAMNQGLVPGIATFDPFPYALLGGFFSLEGVLLAAFVLAKQNRMSARDEERAHLDLQVSLLAEQEVTKAIQMLERVSVALGVEDRVVDAESRELAHNTAVGGLARSLHERLRPEEE